MDAHASRGDSRRIALEATLTFAAVVEVTTGVVLLIAPATVIRWLLGADVQSSALLGRCFGIAVLALGAGCLPIGSRNVPQAFRAMLIYNALVALYLVLVREIAHDGAMLLWPAVALHAAVASVL